MITKRELIADIYNLIATPPGGSLFQASNSVVDYLDRNGLLQGVEGVGTAQTTPEAPEAATDEPRKPDKAEKPTVWVVVRQSWNQTEWERWSERVNWDEAQRLFNIGSANPAYEYKIKLDVNLIPHPVLGANDKEVVELGECEHCHKWSQLHELSVVQRRNRQVLTWEHRAGCSAYLDLLPPHYDHTPTHDPRKSFAYRVPIREIEEMFK